MSSEVSHVFTSTGFAYVAVGALIVWRVIARFRRMIGRQKLSKYRAPITLLIFGLLVAAVGMASRAHPDRLAWLAVALACGLALAIFGLRHTRFETVPGVGLFYTPNAHLGIALSLLFVGRIAYRLYEVFVLHPDALRSAAEFARSPLTLGVFGLLAGYYIGYAIGLARWRAGVFRARRARESAQQDS